MGALCGRIFSAWFVIIQARPTPSGYTPPHRVRFLKIQTRAPWDTELQFYLCFGDLNRANVCLERWV